MLKELACELGVNFPVEEKRKQPWWSNSNIEM